MDIVYPLLFTACRVIALAGLTRTTRFEAVRRLLLG
jgi:hypothetical protein